MTRLPAGWVVAALGDVATEPIQRVPGNAEEFSYIDIASVDRATKRIVAPQRLRGDKAPSRARKVVRDGDVLVSMTRPNLNAVALVPPELDGQIASTGFDILRPTAAEPRYLFGLVRSQQFVQSMSILVQGALYPAVRSKDVRAYPAPVAPLAEQIRIADKLDALLARVDGCRERLDRVPQLLKRFREAVLEAAVSGRLTEEWRDDGDQAYQSASVSEPYHHVVRGAIGWTGTELGAVCNFVGGSQPSKAHFQYEDGPGLIRLIQIRDYKSDRHKTYIPLTLAKRFCSPDDVMIGRYGPPIFQILRGLEGAYNVALMKAVPNDPVMRRGYLYYLLKSAQLLRFVEAGSDRTAGQDGVRKEQLEKYPVFLPPLREQEEIVRRVDALIAMADAIQRRYYAAVAKADKLTPAVLAKGFRGELVPQDPNDEPASMLLDRIQKQREAKAAEGGPRGKSTRAVTGKRERVQGGRRAGRS